LSGKIQVTGGLTIPRTHHHSQGLFAEQGEKVARTYHLKTCGVACQGPVFGKGVMLEKKQQNFRHADWEKRKRRERRETVRRKESNTVSS